MADAVVSKTSGQPPCGFESHLRHQLLTQEGNLFQVPFFAFCPIFPGLLHAQACLLTRAAFAHAAAHPELQPAQGCHPSKAVAYPRSTLESLKTPMRPYTSLYTPIRRCKSRDMRLPSRNELLFTIFWNKKPSFRTGVAKRSKYSSSIETESR